MSFAVSTVATINGLQANPFRINGVRRRSYSKTSVTRAGMAPGIPKSGTPKATLPTSSGGRRYLDNTMVVNGEGSRQARPSDYYSEDSRVILDESVVELCERFNTTHPKALECRRTLRSHIKKGDVTFYRDGKPFKPSQLFLNFFQTECIGIFAMDILDSLLTRGIIPVSYREDANNPLIKIPFVVKGEGFIDRIYNEKVRDYEFHFYRIPSSSTPMAPTQKTGQGPAAGLNKMAFDGILDEEVFVFSKLGFDPGRNGEIMSPIASLLKPAFIKDKYEELILGQISRSQINWLITEPAQAAPDGYGRSDMSRIGAQYDAELMDEEDMERRVAEDNRNVKRIEIQKAIYRRAMENDEDMRAMQQFWHFSDVSRMIAPPRFLSVPAGFKFAHRFEDRSINLDLAKEKEMLDDSIHGVYGVPKSFAEGQGTKTTSATENAAQVMQTNVEEYQAMISVVLSGVLDTLNRMFDIFGDSEGEPGARSEGETSGGGGNSSNSRKVGTFLAENLIANTGAVRYIPGHPPVGAEPKPSDRKDQQPKPKITVTFSSKPQEPFETLAQKFGAGIISFDELATAERGRSGFSAAQNERGEKPYQSDGWTKDDKRMLFTGQPKEKPAALSGGVKKKKPASKTKKKSKGGGGGGSSGSNARKSPKTRPKPKSQK